MLQKVIHKLRLAFSYKYRRSERHKQLMAHIERMMPKGMNVRRQLRKATFIKTKRNK